jgi:hypothetical protein
MLRSAPGLRWRGARRWRAGRVGVACRGGVVAVTTATLICACRERRSLIRRMVPLTKYERRVAAHSARGDRSCGGERPGRPPAVAGSLAGQGNLSPGALGRARGDHRSSAAFVPAG